MDFIRFFEVACHFSQDLICADSDIDSEAQCIFDLVFYFICQGYRVGIDILRAAHIQKALVYGVFLQRGCVFPADVHEFCGAFPIQVEVRLFHYELRAFSQRKADGFSGFDAFLLCRDGFRNYYAFAFILIAADR